MITFKNLTLNDKGLIYSLLTQSYYTYPNIKLKEKWMKDWKIYDNEIFNNINTVGSCCILSFIDKNLIGFFSWDPRKFPIGIIGHNCILPQFQNEGYGKIQLKHIINNLTKSGFKTLFVQTGTENFFKPAQKMYISCGFKEINRNKDTIEYQLELI